MLHRHGLFLQAKRGILRPLEFARHLPTAHVGRAKPLSLIVSANYMLRRHPVCMTHSWLRRKSAQAYLHAVYSFAVSPTDFQPNHVSSTPKFLFRGQGAGAYHSQFNDGDFRSLGNVFLLPLKTTVRGPAPQADPNADDIIDEAIALFRANCFFRNFEIKGNADRVLIYVILFIQDCLGKVNRTTPKSELLKSLNTLALQNFAIPGDKNFVLGGLYQPPASRGDLDTLKSYISQIRQEVAIRLPQRIYIDEKTPSKWWIAFQKKKFMNKSL